MHTAAVSRWSNGGSTRTRLQMVAALLRLDDMGWLTEGDQLWSTTELPRYIDSDTAKG